MARLTDLPTELLALIFGDLGSIDDVHHLGRVCWKTCQVIQNGNAYGEIMRSVIQQSPTHRFDIQLCRILDLHNQIVHHFQEGNLPIIPTTISLSNIAPRATLNYWETQLEHAITKNQHLRDDRIMKEELSNNRIYDILARWQGLKVLQNLWVARQLKGADYLPPSSPAAETFVTALEQLQKRGAELENYAHKDYNSFNSDQTARFYSAVTKFWLLNEIRWVLAQFRYPHPDFSVPLRILDNCNAYIQSQTRTLLLDQLDLSSVYHFLYQHILPLNTMPLLDQDSSELPLTYPFNLQTGAEFNARFLQLCLMAGQTYLQPPDLIDLVIRTNLMRRSPFPSLPLPPSTKSYIRPTKGLNFPANYSLIEVNNLPPNLRPLSAWGSRELSIIQRASITQSLSQPVRHVIMNPHRGLYSISDLLGDWLKDASWIEFDRLAVRDRKIDTRKRFEDCWRRDVRWHVWWWANSEDKARMKIERWMED